MKGIYSFIIGFCLICCQVVVFGEKPPSKTTITTDVLIYSATPSGIMAAITVKKAGYDVIIVEPGRWVCNPGSNGIGYAEL